MSHCFLRLSPNRCSNAFKFTENQTVNLKSNQKLCPSLIANEKKELTKHVRHLVRAVIDVVQIIPIDEKGRLQQEAYDVRIDEMCVIGLRFLDGCAEPTLAVLYEDAKKDRHIKTYSVASREKVCCLVCLFNTPCNRDLSAEILLLGLMYSTCGL